MGPKKNPNQKRKCVYHDRGYCKFGDKCHNQHPDKVCSKNCFNEDCEFRHPNPCKYGQRCLFNKKNICVYSHETFPCNANSENDLELKKKVFDMEKKLKEIEAKETNIEPINIGIAKQVDKKVESLENKMKTFLKVIEEKDSRISSLEKKLENLEKRSKEEKSQKDKKIKDLENLLKKPQNNQREVEQFDCTQCEFTTTSKQGLKTHVKRKHTEIISEKYPKTCELCDAKVNDMKELKLHMKTHSYKESNFQCEDCDFCGPNEYTMEVHTGRYHCTSPDYECGLCDFQAKNVGILETHLSTCEIYECDLCYFRVTQISEMKSHMEAKHVHSNARIWHVKIDRNNDEIMDKSKHWKLELFQQQKREGRETFVSTVVPVKVFYLYMKCCY